MNSTRVIYSQPTSGQIRRQAVKSDRANRFIYSPRSKAKGRTKHLACIIAGLRFAFPPAGYDPESVESLWRETL